MHIILLQEMLLAVAELPQLPILLFVKLHVHNKSGAGAAAAVFCHRVCRMTPFVAVVYCT